MPYQEIQALGFPNSPRKLGLYEKPWACISWYGPCTQLVNSKYKFKKSERTFADCEEEELSSRTGGGGGGQFYLGKRTNKVEHVGIGTCARIEIIIAQGSDSSLTSSFFAGSTKTCSTWTSRENVPGGFEPETP